MKKLLVLLTLSAIGFTSCEKDDNENDTLSQTDREFMTMAAFGNNAEIAAGAMAAAESDNDEVSDFGQMMVADHTTALTDLKAIAGRFAMNLPDSLDSTHQALAKQLDTLAGYQFDSVYIHSQVKDHEKTIELFQNEADNGRESSLKNYANKYLPKLKMHLEKVQEIKGNLVAPSPEP